MKSYPLLTSFLLLLAPMSPNGAETLDQTEVSSFLETLASAEPGSWEKTLTTLKQKYPEWLEVASPAQKLNELSPLILGQDDLDLIHLLQRALRNHDRLSSEKAEPFTIYYKNYQPPDFLIPNIHLTLDVQSDKVRVTTELTVQRNSARESLILDGRNHQFLSVSVNGVPYSKELYRVTQDELILLNIPKTDPFTVVIESEIDPYHNDALEGLYASGKFLTTQCESEGARSIFYTLDRPDVLSRITTTILADAKKYPSRLSNGNRLAEESLPDGRTKIVWEDPIPKPSYLYACVLGDFGKLEDRFTTKSGREVALEVYVEPGKEARASYALAALKWAMQFDEEFFDREYDLDCLKMVAVPDFNFGAMENKGLMIFNDAALLADQHSGTDANFRRIASIVAHEYFHNWSGNRVTVRNWFELSLKEGFTDFRAMLFGEWLFGPAFIRPKDVMTLKENQFPEETSGSGHPIIVESYISASSIYDDTTYLKGREVFRTLQTYMDRMVPDGFRKAQNLYFSRYDGQAVTFRELLTAANEVLMEPTGKNLAQFERWFDQQGTPQVEAKIQYSPGQLQLTVTQSCPHPETGQAQKPYLIPFSYEFLKKDGTVAHPKENCILSENTHQFLVKTDEELIPLFLHGYSAPVLLHYEYSLQDLACLMNHAADPYSQWEAGQNYSLLAIREKWGPDLFKPYSEALQRKTLSPLAKAQLLQTPTLRALSQKFDDYDFASLQKAKAAFTKQLASACKPHLEKLLLDYPEPAKYAPTSEQMEIRELRNACWNLLTKIDPAYYGGKLYKQTGKTDNFDTSFAALKILANLEVPEKTKALADFTNRWKNDKILFNHWLRVQASSSTCTVSDLKALMAVDGYDAKNPNHIRSVLVTFLLNLGQYHDPSGAGYAFIVDQILELGPINPYLAHNNLTALAFIDFEKVPKTQQALMIREMKRLLAPSAPPETRDLVKKMLESV